MNQKLYVLLNYINEEVYVSAKELSLKIQNSEKTLRGRIKELNEIIKSQGAIIESKRGFGYRLNISDKRKFELWKEKQENQTKQRIPESSNERINFILMFLLNQRDYIKREQLCEFLYISEKQVSSYIKQAEII